MWFLRLRYQSACRSFVRLMTRQPGFSHEGRGIPYQGSCVATCTEGYEAEGSISTTSLRCISSGEVVGDAQTVSSSCLQMLCYDTLTQSGVGVNSSCGGASVGDTCKVFCAEGYQAVSNGHLKLDARTTAATTQSSGRVKFLFVLWSLVTSSASLTVDFSERFNLTYNETCIVHRSVGYTGVGDNNTP